MVLNAFLLNVYLLGEKDAYLVENILILDDRYVSIVINVDADSELTLLLKLDGD